MLPIGTIQLGMHSSLDKTRQVTAKIIEMLRAVLNERKHLNASVVSSPQD